MTLFGDFFHYLSIFAFLPPVLRVRDRFRGVIVAQPHPLSSRVAMPPLQILQLLQ